MVATSQEYEGYVAVAKITKPHGIRGEVRVRSFLEESDLLNTFDRFCLKGAGGGGNATMCIQKGRMAREQHYVIAFRAVSTRTQAETLVGRLLYVQADQMPVIDTLDTYYASDLVGMQVCINDAVIGHVTQVMNYGASDLLTITCNLNQRDICGCTLPKEFLLPFAAPYVATIDSENRTLICPLSDSLRALVSLAAEEKK